MKNKRQYYRIILQRQLFLGFAKKKFHDVSLIIENIKSLNCSFRGGLIITTAIKYCFSKNSVAFVTILSLRPFSNTSVKTALRVNDIIIGKMVHSQR